MGRFKEFFSEAPVRRTRLPSGGRFPIRTRSSGKVLTPQEVIQHISDGRYKPQHYQNWMRVLDASLKEYDKNKNHVALTTALADLNKKGLQLNLTAWNTLPPEDLNKNISYIFKELPKISPDSTPYEDKGSFEYIMKQIASKSPGTVKSWWKTVQSYTKQMQPYLQNPKQDQKQRPVLQIALKMNQVLKSQRFPTPPNYADNYLKNMDDQTISQVVQYYNQVLTTAMTKPQTGLQQAGRKVGQVAGAVAKGTADVVGGFVPQEVRTSLKDVMKQGMGTALYGGLANIGSKIFGGNKEKK